MELSAEQLAAVTHEGDRLKILACAGSGKTEVLARRAVRLLLAGTSPRDGGRPGSVRGIAPSQPRDVRRNHARLGVPAASVAGWAA